MLVLERKFDRCTPKETKSKSKSRKASSHRNRSKSSKGISFENEENENFNSAKVLETLSQKLEVQLGYMKKEIM